MIKGKGLVRLWERKGLAGREIPIFAGAGIRYFGEGGNRQRFLPFGTHVTNVHRQRNLGIFQSKDMQTPFPLSFDPVFMDDAQ